MDLHRKDCSAYELAEEDSMFCIHLSCNRSCTFYNIPCDDLTEEGIIQHKAIDNFFLLSNNL